MQSRLRCVALVVLHVIAVSFGQGLAQDTTPEKHVEQIRAEQKQPQQRDMERTLCQRSAQRYTGDGRNCFVHERKLNPETLERDLTALMQKSDEVILASGFLTNTAAISPSGEDVTTYFDAKVLRTWKGSHKVGDLVTFALPQGSISCGEYSVGTDTGRDEHNQSKTSIDYFRDGPYLLFLSRSLGTDANLMPGLRLTGGEGMQGIFSLHLFWLDEKHFSSCACTEFDGAVVGCPKGVAFTDLIHRCISELDVDNEPVVVDEIPGTLGKKYNGMPVSSFLRELQFVVDEPNHLEGAALARKIHDEGRREKPVVLQTC